MIYDEPDYVFINQTPGALIEISCKLYVSQIELVL